MKRLLCLSFATLLVVLTVSCNKDNNGKKGNVKVPVPEAVDLGLSVKWASFNLGASSELEPGNYYSWGEMSVKQSYGDGPEYVFRLDPENLTTAGFDVARKLLGGGWRMPTKEELSELCRSDNCRWVLDESRKCIKITSYVNDNFICIPVSGLKAEHGELEDSQDVYFWSSTRYENKADEEAYCGYFQFQNDGYAYGVVLVDRFYGVPIRPVYED